ncbi:MAG: VWA domain-containing protein, partial [Chloroflexota bacterium]|nr:VWA domain-containing protein [Chloroflexota bacterium]
MVYRYSRWDGTQQIMPFDADAIMEAIAEDVLAHGDVRRALEKLMQQGHKFQSGERMPGLRDLIERLKQQRQDTLRRNNMDGVIKDIQQRLDKIKETEREGIDRRVEEGRQKLEQEQQEGHPQEQEGASSDANPQSEIPDPKLLQRMLEKMAERRREQLEQLPKDIGGQIKGLREYDFMDPDARRQFQDLLDMLQQQMMQNNFSGMQKGMQQIQQDPRAMEEMREMLRDLNQLMRDRQEGRPNEQSRFNDFMQKHGHNFPPGIENMDQLMEHLQKQMQYMENMLNSMSPQQRAELEEAMMQIMQDPGLQAEMNELAMHLSQMMPPQPGRQYRFSGDPDESMSMAQAMSVMEQLDQMEQLERELNAARRGDPNLENIDADEVEQLLGPDARQALEQLRELAQQLEDAGYLEWDGSQMQLTPRAIRKVGQKALHDIFGLLKKDAFGKHAISVKGRGGERTYDSKAYEFGDPFYLDLNTTLGNALLREGTAEERRPRAPRPHPAGRERDDSLHELLVQLKPEDFQVFSTEYMTQSSTCLLIDMSRSMLLRGCFLAAKKVALALNHLIRSQFPKDDLYIIGFSGYARELKPEMLPQLDWSEYQYGTNLPHALMLSRQLLGRRKSPNKQIIVITDGEPTAHLEDGEVFFNYPPTFRTIQETMREVVRCTRDQIVINTFMLERSYYMADFVEQMTKVNRGRAFYATPEALGEYILVDYVASKKKRVK